MKEIINLITHKETMNLGLSLLCKKYNFRIRDRLESVPNKENFIFVTIILSSLDIDKKVIFKSLNKLKCQINDNRSTFDMNYVSAYVRKSVFSEIELSWYVKN